MLTPQVKHLNVVYCYARNDQDLCKKLDRHLASLKHDYDLKTWFDCEILPGENWEEAIKTQLDQADLILLLISADFVASDYCYNKEMPRALERHDRKEAKVIPILLRPVRWSKKPFEGLQMLPNNGQPVTQWSDSDVAFLDIAQGIERVVKELRAEWEKKQKIRDEVTLSSSQKQPPSRRKAPALTRFLVLLVTLADMAFLDIAQGIKRVVKQQLFPGRKAPALTRFLVLLVTLAGMAFLDIGPAASPPAISQQTIQIDGSRFRIGISDSVASMFTTTDELKQNSLLKSANGRPANNANVPANGEYCIYQQDQRITASASSVTVVAAETLSIPTVDIDKVSDQVSFEVGNDSLQGLCQKQAEYNSTHPGKEVRILVANIGTQNPDVLAQTMPRITQKIIKLASQDSSFIGVVGFPYSATLEYSNPTVYSMDQLKNAGIPVISSTAAAASSDPHSSTSGSDFSYRWPGYFYRVNPGDAVEGKVAANYAYNTLHSKTAFVFYAPNSPYSDSLEQSFVDSFSGASLQRITNDSSFATSLEKLAEMKKQPDIIFCACFDAGTVPAFSDFYNAYQASLHKYPILSTIKLMGGGGLYGPQGNDSSNGVIYYNIYFTSYTFPDTISQICNSTTVCSPEQINFYNKYCQTFAPASYQPHASMPHAACQSYGSSRPSKDTMLSYDALSLLLNAYGDIHTQNSGSLLEPMHTALLKASVQGFQGITGWIQFNTTSSDPVHKMVLVLYVDDKNRASLQGCYGQFTQKLSFLKLPPANCVP